MDQLSSQLMLLFLILVVVGIIVEVAVVLSQKVAKTRVDHSIEQSSSGIVMEDQEDIEKKIFLEDKIQHLSSTAPKNDKLLKFN